MTELLFAAVALAAIVLSHLQTRTHQRQVDGLLAAAAARELAFGRERDAWARERWDLNTRLTAPEVARAAPLAPPQPTTDPFEALAAAGITVQPDENDDEPDESHLIGVVAGPGREGGDE